MIDSPHSESCREISHQVALCKETRTDGYTAVQEGFNQAQCKLLKIPSLRRFINLSSEEIISQNMVSVLFRDPKPENNLHIGENR